MQPAGLHPARGWAAQGGESSRLEEAAQGRGGCRPGRGGAGEELPRPRAGGGDDWWVVAQTGAAARARAAERRRAHGRPRVWPGLVIVMNSTCIHHEDSRPKYIHVQVLGNMHKTPYTMGKLQDIHIHLTPPSNSRWINDTEFGEIEPVLNSGMCLLKKSAN